MKHFWTCHLYKSNPFAWKSIKHNQLAFSSYQDNIIALNKCLTNLPSLWDNTNDLSFPDTDKKTTIKTDNQVVIDWANGNPWVHPNLHWWSIRW
jgi:hypothetical protein